MIILPTFKKKSKKDFKNVSQSLSWKCIQSPKAENQQFCITNHNSLSRYHSHCNILIILLNYWHNNLLRVLYNKQHPNSNIIMLCFLGKHVALHRIRYSKVIFPPISCYSLLLLHFVTALYYNLGYHTTLNLYDYYNAQYHIHSTMIHKIHISNLL